MFNGLTISDTLVKDKQRFLIGFLQNKVSEGNFSEGSFLHDSLIKPMAYILALIEAETTQVLATQTVSKLAEVETETATQVLDNLADNWFITRKGGTRAQGTVTIQLDRSVSFILPVGTLFTKQLGIDFIYDAEADLQVSASDLETGLDADGNTIYTYSVLVVGVRSYVGANLSPGDFQSMTNMPMGFVKCFNDSAFSSAEAEESNYTLASRLKSALTNRSFLTRDSIRSYLLDEIISCKAVNVVGAGDSAMQRDILVIDNTVFPDIHTLGMVNVYANTGFNLVTDKYTAAVPNGALSGYARTRLCHISLSGTYGFKSIHTYGLSSTLNLYGKYRIEDLPLGGAAAATRKAAEVAKNSSRVTVSLALPDNTKFTRSKDESVSVVVNGIDAADNLSVSSLIPKDLGSVETLASSSSVRVSGSDLLVYAPTVKYLYVSFSYIPQPTPPTATFPTTTIQVALADYVNSLNAAYKQMSLADILTYVDAEFNSYIQYIDMKTFVVEYSVLLPDGNIVWYTVKSNTAYSDCTSYYINLHDVSGVVTETTVVDYASLAYLESLQVNDSTSCIHLEASNISMTEVSV